MAVERKTVGKYVPFICPICLEPIKKPKCLPCTHTFCEACLQSYITRASIGKEEAIFEFSCPVCRGVTGCPKQDVPVEEWAKHFPAHAFLNSLNLLMGDKPDDNPCAVCLRDNKQIKAENWCRECQEFICAFCTGQHRIFVSLQNHKISEITAMHDGEENMQVPDLDEPCCAHTGEFMKVFCLDHDKLCCSICFATQHRHCERVEALEEIIKEMQETNVDCNIDVLTRIAKGVERLIEQKELKIKETNARKDTILSNAYNEIENLKSRLDECQQQFEKVFIKSHEENEEKLKQCVFDLKQFLLTVKNGEALLSAIQRKGSARQAFIAALKTIAQVEEQFEQFKTIYSKDEEIQYVHDHTTILKQVYEKDKIEDVTMVEKQTGIIWSLSRHLPSLRTLQNAEDEQSSALFKNVYDPNALKVEKKSEFQIPGSSHQGIFVNNETLIFACSAPNSLKAFHLDGTAIEFSHSVELKSKPCLSTGSTRNVLYISCQSSIYKLKIRKRKKNVIDATCMAELNVKESFDAFCVDEDQTRIIVATKAKITIFTLDPVLQVQTAHIQSPGIDSLPSQCLTRDRLVGVKGEEAICFSLSGQQMFRYKNPNIRTIKAVTFDPLNNVYAAVTINLLSCNRFSRNLHFFDLCHYCDESSEAHKDKDGVFQILADGSNGRSLIADYPNALFLFLDKTSEQFILSDGKKCTVYRLSI